MDFKIFSEDLKIKKKTFPTSYRDYSLEFYNTDSHNIFQKIKARSSITTYSEFKNSFFKALDYLISQNLQKREFVGISMDKSKYKIGLIINPIEKYIRVNTILDYSMELRDKVVYELNEFEENFFKVDDLGYYVFDSFKDFNNSGFVNESVDNGYFMKEYNEVHILEMKEINLFL